MAQTELHLTSEMAELISAALAEGLATSPNEVVVLALRTIWAEHLASLTPHTVQQALRVAGTDIRPGRSLDEVFARLNQQLNEVPGSTRADAA